MLGLTLANFSECQEKAGRYAEAEKNLRRSRDVFLALAAEKPTIANRTQAHDKLGLIGLFLKRRRRFDDAVVVHRKMLEESIGLAEERPEDPVYQQRLAVSMANLAGCLREMAGKRPEAIGLYQQAIVLLQKQLAAHPSNLSTRKTLEDLHSILAGALVGSSDPAEWRPQEAMAHAQKAIELMPKECANAWYHLGLAQFRVGDSAAAVRSFTTAETLDKLNDTTLCKLNYFLARSHAQVGNKKDARVAFDRAEKLWGKVGKSLPVDPAILKNRAEAASLLGISLPAATGPKMPIFVMPL